MQERARSTPIMSRNSSDHHLTSLRAPRGPRTAPPYRPRRPAQDLLQTPARRGERASSTSSLPGCKDDHARRQGAGTGAARAVSSPARGPAPACVCRSCRRTGCDVPRCRSAGIAEHAELIEIAVASMNCRNGAQAMQIDRLVQFQHVDRLAHCQWPTPCSASSRSSWRFSHSRRTAGRCRPGGSAADGCASTQPADLGGSRPTACLPAPRTRRPSAVPAAADALTLARPGRGHPATWTGCSTALEIVFETGQGVGEGFSAAVPKASARSSYCWMSSAQPARPAARRARPGPGAPDRCRPGRDVGQVELVAIGFPGTPVITVAGSREPALASSIRHDARLGQPGARRARRLPAPGSAGNRRRVMRRSPRSRSPCFHRRPRHRPGAATPAARSATPLAAQATPSDALDLQNGAGQVPGRYAEVAARLRPSAHTWSWSAIRLGHAALDQVEHCRQPRQVLSRSPWTWPPTGRGRTGAAVLFQQVVGGGGAGLSQFADLACGCRPGRSGQRLGRTFRERCAAPVTRADQQMLARAVEVRENVATRDLPRQRIRRRRSARRRDFVQQPERLPPLQACSRRASASPSVEAG